MLSIIIATYNEEKIIAETLSGLLKHNLEEIIVVDGDSEDRTPQIVSEFPVRLIRSKKNRAAQYNCGAKQAKGDILVFLHADCRLEKGSVQAIKAAISRGYIGGCLQQKILDEGFVFRLIEGSGNLRAKICKIFYGDQAIFVRRDVFLESGGYDEVGLFDDVLFSKKIKRKGKTAVLDKKVYTHARRWKKQGIVKATLINWLVSLGFILGVSPDILRKAYKDIR